MPSTATPQGLRPFNHPSGVGVRTTEAGTILTGYATNILQYAPVRIATDGSLEIAAAGTRGCGTFLGVEYTDSNGRRQYANQWTASTAGTAIVAYYTRDQKLRYIVQSSATLALTDMGKQYDWGTATNGNTTTGLSTVTLDATTSASNAGLRVIGLAPTMSNAWDDTYVDVIVEIAEHQDTADVAAY